MPTRSRDGQAAVAQARGGSRRPMRLASLVVDELAHEIIGGSIPPGSPLPTEDALCKRFGFSRTVMREGLKLLEERGLIRVEQGRGTTVQPRESWNLLDPDVLRVALEYDADTVLLNDLITVRRLLEDSMTRAAAPRLSDEQLADLAANVEAMAGSVEDWPAFQQLDQAFHRTLMKASGSEIGQTIVRAIHEYTARNPVLNSPVPAPALARTVEEHRAIYAALAQRDAELAANLITGHIDSSWSERRSARPARRR